MARNKILSVACIFITIAAIFINFNSFLMGHPADWGNILTTLFYVVFWYIFILNLKNNKKSLIYSAVWGLFTFMCAVIILIVNIKTVMIDWAIPMVIVFISPLYAMEALFFQFKNIFSAVAIIIISLTWVIMSLIFIRRKK